MEGTEVVSGQHHFMLSGLLPSDTMLTRRYRVQVFSTTEQGERIPSSGVFFRTKTYGKSNEDSCMYHLYVHGYAYYMQMYNYTYRHIGTYTHMYSYS